MDASAARYQLALDRVLVVVARDPWQKSGTVSAPAELRYEMLVGAPRPGNRSTSSCLLPPCASCTRTGSTGREPSCRRGAAPARPPRAGRGGVARGRGGRHRGPARYAPEVGAAAIGEHDNDHDVGANRCEREPSVTNWWPMTPRQGSA